MCSVMTWRGTTRGVYWACEVVCSSSTCLLDFSRRELTGEVHVVFERASLVSETVLLIRVRVTLELVFYYVVFCDDVPKVSSEKRRLPPFDV